MANRVKGNPPPFFRPQHLTLAIPLNISRQISRDVRYSLRLWARRPWQTGFAILALAIGIGANTGVFSVVNALLWRSLPFRDPSRLASILSCVLFGVLPSLYAGRIYTFGTRSSNRRRGARPVRESLVAAQAWLRAPRRFGFAEFCGSKGY